MLFRLVECPEISSDNYFETLLLLSCEESLYLGFPLP